MPLQNELPQIEKAQVLERVIAEAEAIMQLFGWRRPAQDASAPTDKPMNIDTVIENETGKLTVIGGEAATDTRLVALLGSEKFHIIHFCGHARFDNKAPDKSRLLLYKSDFDTANIYTFVYDAEPILCFINACQTANAPDFENRFELRGLGKAFLETGAYLLGSRSLISDDAASKFAEVFYLNLLKKRKSFGESVLRARQACKETAKAGAFDWASYVFYGDPRVGMPKGSAGAPKQPSPTDSRNLPNTGLARAGQELERTQTGEGA